MAEPFIKIRGLTQRFGENEVLLGIDMDVFRGETLVILGSSGGGKSVLLKHLPGLLKATGGTIHVDGVEISELGERALGPIRRQMGVMFQGGALFDSFTVAENVAFPLRESGLTDEAEIAARVAEALEIVRMPGEEEKLPVRAFRRHAQAGRAGAGRGRQAGLRTLRRATCRTRSRDGGLHRPPDQGFAANHGITNVVITHDMRSVFHIADRVVFLEKGLVHWTGTPAEIRDAANPELQAFVAGDSGEPWE